MTLSLLLIFSLYLSPTFSTEPADQSANPSPPPFTDIDQHWAKGVITRAFVKSIILGYGDGTFRPDLPATYADFGTMIARSGAIYAGLKWPSGTAPDPNAFITRQEAAAILGRMLPDTANPSTPTTNTPNTLTPDTSLLEPFVDKDQVADWARSGMIKLLQLGYLKGHEDGRLDPGGLLTRSEAITLLNRLSSGNGGVRLFLQLGSRN